MKRRWGWAAVLALIVAAGLTAAALDWTAPEPRLRALWRSAVVPGPLSGSHAFLGRDCTACHTALKGVQTLQCVACHADNTALLQRQPTAFHAQVPRCTGCHVEHQGGARMPTTMDHALLVRLAPTRREHAGAPAPDAQAARVVNGLFAATPAPPAGSNEEAQQWGVDRDALARMLPLTHPRLDAARALDCAACHGTKDRHQRMLGADCAQCHSTEQWRVAQFRHPSPRSMDCAQCHRPPPSHTMMHFEMVSARVARQPGARVNQCYACHQTTSWNDIRGVGYYKHH